MHIVNLQVELDAQRSAIIHFTYKQNYQKLKISVNTVTLGNERGIVYVPMLAMGLGWTH